VRPYTHFTDIAAKQRQEWHGLAAARPGVRSQEMESRIQNDESGSVEGASAAGLRPARSTFQVPRFTERRSKSCADSGLFHLAPDSWLLF